jgi:hypothetical protein
MEKLVFSRNDAHQLTFQTGKCECDSYNTYRINSKCFIDPSMKSKNIDSRKKEIEEYLHEPQLFKYFFGRTQKMLSYSEKNYTLGDIKMKNCF